MAYNGYRYSIGENEVTAIGLRLFDRDISLPAWLGQLVEAGHFTLGESKYLGGNLEYSKAGLSWVFPHDQKLKPFTHNFSLFFDKRKQSEKRGPLAKAIGKPCNVLDTTCGLGRDALRLISWGHRVTGVERCPVLYALLEDARQRFPELEDKFELVFGEASEQMAKLSEYDVVYLDPMFFLNEEKKKSAKASKEMTLVQELLGDNGPFDYVSNELDLLALSLESNIDRVVVKRPLKGHELAPGAIASFKGKAIRYDLYKPNGGRAV